jgi:hypothetical protein
MLKTKTKSLKPKTKSLKTKTITKSLKNKYIDNNLFSNFQKEITILFLEILLMIKLFHWKTTSYAIHKATDEVYSKLNTNIDSFIEVLLGKTGKRTDLMNHKNIQLIDLNSVDSFKFKIYEFKKYLINLNFNKAMLQMSNTDLYNIRDTILGDMNQLLYLLSLN